MDCSRGVRQKSPYIVLRDHVLALMEEKGAHGNDSHAADTIDILQDVPRKWEVHGDLILIPKTAFVHAKWQSVVPELWKVVAQVWNALQFYFPIFFVLFKSVIQEHP